MKNLLWFISICCFISLVACQAPSKGNQEDTSGKEGVLIQPVTQDSSMIDPVDSTERKEVHQPGMPQDIQQDTSVINKKRKKNN